jgi:hypothetical protein
MGVQLLVRTHTNSFADAGSGVIECNAFQLFCMLAAASHRVIPATEPSSFALILLGPGGLLALRKRMGPRATSAPS